MSKEPCALALIVGLSVKEGKTLEIGWNETYKRVALTYLAEAASRYLDDEKYLEFVCAVFHHFPQYFGLPTERNFLRYLNESNDLSKKSESVKNERAMSLVGWAVIEKKGRNSFLDLSAMFKKVAA